MKLLFLLAVSLSAQTLSPGVTLSKGSTVTASVNTGITLVASNLGAQSTDQNTVSNTGFDTSGSNFMIAGLSEFTGMVAPTDNYSNTWVPLGIYTQACNVEMYYCIGCTVGPGHVLSVSASGHFPTITGILAFSGVKTVSPQDGLTTGAVSGGTSNTVTPTAITPGATNELFVTALCSFGSATGTVSLSSPFTLLSSYLEGSNALGGGFGYYLSPSTSPQGPTWTTDISVQSIAATLALFKHQ